jgi:UDP-glucuronate decarboxylase
MQNSFLDSDIEEIAKGLGSEADKLAGKTLLLTGGGGFLGRYFQAVIRHLNRLQLAKPCKMITLDNLITKTTKPESNLVDENMRFTLHDVIKPFEIDEHIDYVVHAAGIASPFYYRTYPLETLEVTTTGTKNMLELARRNDARFIFFSSSEIYGDPDPKHVPMQESYRGNVAVAGPRACYDESKRLGETLCYIFHEKYGTSTNAIRPFNIFGPGMLEKDYRVMPNFASRIKSGRPLSVYGSGGQTRTFCYISDAMVGFFRTIIRGVPGEAYNIGNPEPEISMLDLVLRIEKVLGRNITHNIIEYPDSYPADEPQRRCPDIRKAQLQLDFQPRVSLEEGLRRFLGWTDQTYTGNV